MIKIIGFMLMMTNTTGGPITQYFSSTYGANQFETKSECEEAADLIRGSSKLNNIVLVCMPMIKKK
jgi:hypothetical protein